MIQFLYILLFIFGLFLLLKGADIITNYASRIARALGVSELVIGITLVAIATSLPELAVCITSAFSGVASISTGTIIGSNITNIGLVLGLAALTTPFITKREYLRQGYFMFGFSILGAFLILGGMFWFEGVVLIALALIYMVWLVRSRKSEIGASGKKQIRKWCEIKYLLFCLIGGIGVIIGANIIVTSTVEIAKWFGVSELFISLIIIAVGTSLPELATSVVAARKRMRGISLGNIIGSNIFNLMILGISSLVVVAPVTTSMILVNIPIMLIITGALLIFMRTEWKKTPMEAIILIIIYIIFVALQFVI